MRKQRQSRNTTRRLLMVLVVLWGRQTNIYSFLSADAMMEGAAWAAPRMVKTLVVSGNVQPSQGDLNVIRV